MQPDEKINEKIKRIRRNKKWSQEDMAHQLNIATSTYGDIERGVSKLSLQRLEEIAKIFEVGLAELIDLNAKNIFNFKNIHGDHCQNWYNNPSSEQILELQHELEKARLLLQERDKEISYLKEDKEQLKEMIALLKNHQQK